MKSTEIGGEFEKKVQRAFQLMGFEVERDVLLAGSQIDLCVTQSTGLIEQFYIVECKAYSEKVGVSQLREFYALVNASRAEQPGLNGIFVSKAGFANTAKAFARTVGVRCVTLSELERQLIDLKPYARSLQRLFQNKFAATYIEPRGYLRQELVPTSAESRMEVKERIPRKNQSESAKLEWQKRAKVALKSICDMAPKESASFLNRITDDLDSKENLHYELGRAFATNQWLREHREPIMAVLSASVVGRDTSHELASPGFGREFESLESLIDSWVNSDDCRVIIVVGDFGTGKTLFLQSYAARLAERYLHEPNERRCPILVPLKGFPQGLTPQLLVSAVTSETGCQNLTSDILNAYHSDGRLVYLLDGFDEMGMQVNAMVRRSHFASIAGLASESRAKIVVTGRPGYFPSQGEFEEVVDMMASVGGVGTSPVRVISVAPFNEAQIEKFAEAYAKVNPAVDARKVLAFIQNVYNLRDLATRPFLLDLIVKTIPELSQEKGELTPSKLYDVYTSRWIRREALKGESRLLLSASQRLEFVIELAWRMAEEGSLSVHFSAISEWVREHFELLVPETVDYFAHDISTCTFLSRNDQGQYTFVHKSFMEYFVARRMAEKAMIGEPVPRFPGAKSLADVPINSVGFLLEILGAKISKYPQLVSELFPVTTSPAALLRRVSGFPKSIALLTMSVLQSDSRYGLRPFIDRDGKIILRDNIFSFGEKIASKPVSSKKKSDNKESDKKVEIELFCSFCDRSQYKASKLIAGPGVYICDCCVGEVFDRILRLLLSDRKQNKELGSKEYCSFCGKRNTEVQYLFAHAYSKSFICDECIELCGDIVYEGEPDDRDSAEGNE